MGVSNPTCCGCRGEACCDRCLPVKLVATGQSTDCTCSADPFDIELFFDDVKDAWVGSGSFGGCPGSVSLTLKCLGSEGYGGCEEFELTVILSCDYPEQSAMANPGCTCDPLSLTFDYGDSTHHENCCDAPSEGLSGFGFTITEGS